MDLQDRSPELNIEIDRVGITDLESLIRIKREGKEFIHIPKVSIFIDLEKNRKGIHMSRLIESIDEIFEKEIEKTHFSLEEVGREILIDLKEKQKYRRAEIIINSKIVLYKKTPLSQKKTTECYNIEVRIINREKFKKILKVEVIGNTCCPHSLEKSEYKRAHSQRAIGFLEINTDFNKTLRLEDMIEAVESSFSSRTYTVLKTKDEVEVVGEMYKNPKFVEDVVRNIVRNSEPLIQKGTIRATCISQESIHKHNAYAEIKKDII